LLEREFDEGKEIFDERIYNDIRGCRLTPA